MNIKGIFLTSDYMERDPERKFYVGLGHGFLGVFLFILGLPLWVIVIVYIAKEVFLDLRGKFNNWRVWADSTVDFIFTILGALAVAYMDWRYGAGVFAIAFSYFAAEKYSGR